jgi:hypothetical protein
VGDVGLLQVVGDLVLVVVHRVRLQGHELGSML